MTDSLAAKLRASTLNDTPQTDDWKKSLNIPTRDNRQQTEVCILHVGEYNTLANRV